MNTDQNVSLVSPVMSAIDQHSKIEDALAMLIGTFILSFAMTLLQQAGIMTGGTAGLSLLIHYVTDIKFGVLFFLINIPFYYFALINAPSYIVLFNCINSCKASFGIP